MYELYSLIFKAIKDKTTLCSRQSKHYNITLRFHKDGKFIKYIQRVFQSQRYSRVFSIQSVMTSLDVRASKADEFSLEELVCITYILLLIYNYVSIKC